MDVQVSHLSKAYGRRTVLSEVSFTLPGPGVYGLLGPNGAGKSTLMKLLASVLPFRTGMVRYGAWELPRDVAEVRRHLGYLPQLFGLYDYMTGAEFVRYAANLKGFKAQGEARQWARDLLQDVGLENDADRRIQDYSGGMRQRLALAQCLLGWPTIYILDEPSAGLDPEERTRLRNLVASRAQDAVVLVSTHIVSDLEHLAREVFVLGRGTVVAQGSPEAISLQAQGKVFRVRTHPDHWNRLAPLWMSRRSSAPGAIPVRHPIVVTLNVTHREADVRVLADEAPTDPELTVDPVGPTLEDGYLALTAQLGAES